LDVEGIEINEERVNKFTIGEYDIE